MFGKLPPTSPYSIMSKSKHFKCRVSLLLQSHVVPSYGCYAIGQSLFGGTYLLILIISYYAYMTLKAGRSRLTDYFSSLCVEEMYLCITVQMVVVVDDFHGFMLSVMYISAPQLYEKQGPL